jgi:hypothetical protein
MTEPILVAVSVSADHSLVIAAAVVVPTSGALVHLGRLEDQLLAAVDRVTGWARDDDRGSLPLNGIVALPREEVLAKASCTPQNDPDGFSGAFYGQRGCPISA